jgi:toxin ParE1/3/4
MPAFRVCFHRLAAQEYRAAKHWYREHSLDASQRFCLAVDRAVDRISEVGGSLPILREPYRYLRVPRFPYVLVFRFNEDNAVLIVAVAHTSRRPEYWRRRR